MPKGRIFAPTGTRDGLWYQHHIGGGAMATTSLKRDEATTTEYMLTGPYDSQKNWYPWVPPKKFQARSSSEFYYENKFSDHDNRHHFQNKGEYFEDGKSNRVLGKRITQPEKRQHFTSNEYLHHQGRVFQEFNYGTNYERSYRGAPTTEPPRYRRFARSLPLAPSGSCKLSTSTTDWWPADDNPKPVGIRTLANSQVPYQQNTGRWRYSNQGSNNMYPPLITAKRATTLV